MSAIRRTTRLRAGFVAVTAAAAMTAATLPAALGTAAADPLSSADSQSSLGSLSETLQNIPLTEIDSALAEAVRQARTVGLDQQATEVLQKLLQAEGQPNLDSLLSGDLPGGQTPDEPQAGAPATDPPATDAPATEAPATEAPEDETAEDEAPAADTPNALSPTQADSPIGTAATGLELLEKTTGAKMLTPALAPFCTDPTADNPLGLATAPALAFPGPFPNAGNGQSLAEVLKALNIPLLGDALDQNADIREATSFLNSEQTAYALLPPTDTATADFQVAWFNTSTFEGGLTELKTLGETSESGILRTLLQAFPNGLRLARVNTGDGSILTAIFGTTTTTAGRSCIFLPALGIVDNPA